MNAVESTDSGQVSPGIVVDIHRMNWPKVGLTGEQIVEILDNVSFRLGPVKSQADRFMEYGHVVLEPR